jgi:phage shock protein PspC (stress-responsive transcriptional regulator)
MEFTTKVRDTLNHLVRPTEDRVIGGVCAGFARATETPNWVWRAGFVFALLAFGAGAIFYLIMWFFMPSEGNTIS